jgi:hypothetical protein
MFNNYTITQLKSIIRTYKEHHTIKNYSKLKKLQLVETLNNFFYIENNLLYKKVNTPQQMPEVKKPAVKKPAVKKPAVKKPAVKKPAVKSNLKKLEKDYDNMIEQISADNELLHRSNTNSKRKAEITTKINAHNIKERKMYKQLKQARAENAFLSGYLGFDKKFEYDDDNITSMTHEKINIVNSLFDILDNLYTKDDVFEYSKYVTDETSEYLTNWLDKKTNAKHGVEYTSFVTLVIYPHLLKNVIKIKGNKSIDEVKLMMLANDLANDGSFNVYDIGPKNRYRVVETFIRHGKKTGITPRDLGNKFMGIYKYAL